MLGIGFGLNRRRRKTCLWWFTTTIHASYYYLIDLVVVVFTANLSVQNCTRQNYSALLTKQWIIYYVRHLYGTLYVFQIAVRFQVSRFFISVDCRLSTLWATSGIWAAPPHIEHQINFCIFISLTRLLAKQAQFLAKNAEGNDSSKSKDHHVVSTVPKCCDYEIRIVLCLSPLQPHFLCSSEKKLWFERFWFW